MLKREANARRKFMKACTILLLLTVVMASSLACSHETSAHASATTNSEPAVPVSAKSEMTDATEASASAAPAPAAADSAPLPHIDAKRAFEYTREVTAFGERYMGNKNHERLEHYILDHLKGDDVEIDAFTA